MRRQTVNQIFCFILLLVAFLYSGRGIYTLFIGIIFYYLNKKGYIGRNSFFMSCLIIGSFFILTIIAIVESSNILRVSYMLVLYIPFFIYVFKDILFPGSDKTLDYLSIILICVDFLAVLQFIYNGYSRTGIKIVGASINYLAALNLQYFVIVGGYIVRNKSMSWMMKLGVLCSVLIICISLSRVCIAMLLIDMLCLYLMFFKKSKNKVGMFIKLIFAIMALSGLFILTYPYFYENSVGFRSSMQSFNNYFSNIREIGLGGSRQKLWTESIKEIREYLLFGKGSYIVRGENKASHNFILEILLLGGIYGLLIYVLVYSYLLHQFCKTDSSSRKLQYLLCVNYWGICLLQPFLTTSYCYSIIMGYGLLCILDRGVGDENSICM